MASRERMKGTAGLIDIISGPYPRKTKLPYRYVRDHGLGALVLRLTGHRYGGYELPSVSTLEPTLVLPYSKIICCAIFMSPFGHR